MSFKVNRHLTVLLTNFIFFVSFAQIVL